MSWSVSPWVYPVCSSLGFLDLGGYFLSYFREFFNYNLLKYFLIPFPFVFFWDPCNSNVGCLMLSQRCLSPSSLLLILFSFMVFCFSYFHQCIFQLTHLFFCLSYSTVGSLQFTFNLSYSLFIIVYSLIHLGPR